MAVFAEELTGHKHAVECEVRLLARLLQKDEEVVDGQEHVCVQLVAFVDFHHGDFILSLGRQHQRTLSIGVCKIN